jgi:hypothetical protein
MESMMHNQILRIISIDRVDGNANNNEMEGYWAEMMVNHG